MLFVPDLVERFTTPPLKRPNSAGGLLDSILNSWMASTTGKMIDPAIEPIYSDEVLIGYSTPVAERYSVDVFFISRTMKRFIEDVPSRLNGPEPNAGPYVAANLPCRGYESCRNANAVRRYRAFTVDARRRLTNGWTTDVSYTWSRFEGNFDLDYSLVSVFNTSSFIQDAPGANVEDPNRFGPLFDIERMGGVFTLAAMSVPAAEFEHTAAAVNALPEVAHNYAREHPLNMWFVLATESAEATAAAIDRIEASAVEVPR